MLSIADADINDDRTLLTTAELRVAAGLSATDSSQDAVLTPLGSYVDALITKACGVQSAGAIPPTLRLETVTETFLFKTLHKSLVLARRPIVEIISVTQGGSVLSADDYEADESSGILYRKNWGQCYFERGNYWCWWPCGSTVVEYSAGYDDVPADLKYAAIKFIQAEKSQGSRDPNLKTLEIMGVSRREWWVSSNQKMSVVPAEVMDILVRGGYANGIAFA